MAPMSQTKLVADAQENFLRAVEQAQDASLRLASALVPQPQHLPTPAQAIESGFAFAGRLLDLQKRYALGLVGTISSPEPARSA